ncbi:MAG: hypothetical protein JW702_04725, partial [Clostridiales bacterium]|nr:hypothetical protein [Clostridiales bacterium]
VTLSKALEKWINGPEPIFIKSGVMNIDPVLAPLFASTRPRAEGFSNSQKAENIWREEAQNSFNNEGSFVGQFTKSFLRESMAEIISTFVKPIETAIIITGDPRAPISQRLKYGAFAAADITLTALGFKTIVSSGREVETLAEKALTTADDIANFKKIRDTSRFLKERGITDKTVRRNIIEAGFDTPISSNFDRTAQRFDKLFVRPFKRNKGYRGRLGNLETRVSTIDKSLDIEMRGLIPRFEVRANNRYLDIVATDPLTRDPLELYQVIKRNRLTNAINPREIPAQQEIEEFFDMPVHFITSGNY